MGGVHRPTGDINRQLSTASLRVADVYFGAGGGDGGDGGGGGDDGGDGGDGGGDGGHGGDGGGDGGRGGDGGGGSGGGSHGGGGGGGGSSAVHTDPPDPVNASAVVSSERLLYQDNEQSTRLNDVAR